MDEVPIGPAARDAPFQRRKRDVDWADLLTEMQIDKMSYAQRRNFLGHQDWINNQVLEEQERKERAPTRRYLIMTGLGFAVTLVAAFGSFLGAEIAAAGKTPSPCPAGYVCVAAPAPTPTALQP